MNPGASEGGAPGDLPTFGYGVGVRPSQRGQARRLVYQWATGLATKAEATAPNAR